MNRRIAAELEFDKVLQLVAAHAQTRAGRERLYTQEVLLPFAVTLRNCHLTLQMQQLLAEAGRLDLAGIDEAVPWLDPATPTPTEPRELLLLVTLALRVTDARRQLLATPAELDLLHVAADVLPDLSGLASWAGQRLGREGQVPDEASPELARLRRQGTRLRQELLGTLDTIRRDQADVVTDAPPTLRRDRYCLPVKAAARHRMPGLVLDSSGSGVTAFLEPFAVVELNNDLADTLAREGEEVRRLLAEVAAAFSAVRGELAAAVDVLGEVDAAQARALFGARAEGRLVIPGECDALVLRAARHQLLDERLGPLRAEILGEVENRSRKVVPLDLELPAGVRTLVVSGPNAGGKTVVLKSVGLLVLMAAHGIPLPAADGTGIPRFNNVWCHIGDEQNVAADLSTFSAAMAATAELLTAGDASTLVVYDELGSGTDPLEGAALGCALLEELTRRGCLTIASTHLASVALTAGSSPGMASAAMEYDEAVERPTFALRVGRPGRSRALEIARLMGVSGPVVDRARELLGGHHLELDRWLGRLEEMETSLTEERATVARSERELAAGRQALEVQQVRLEAEARKQGEGLIAERDRLRRRASEQLDAALRELDEAARADGLVGKRRRQRLREVALDLPLPAAFSEPQVPSLVAGTEVRFGRRTGLLRELRGTQALVEVAGKRLWVPAAELAPNPQPTAAAARVEVALMAAGGVADEIVLLGMDSERAREELEHYLDRAVAAGKSTVRVVHGHGTGTLRQMVATLCRSHPAVSSFHHPPQHLGGSGATEVSLRGDDDG